VPENWSEEGTTSRATATLDKRLLQQSNIRPSNEKSRLFTQKIQEVNVSI
jgi:hypothetical protein